MKYKIMNVKVEVNIMKIMIVKQKLKNEQKK